MEEMSLLTQFHSTQSFRWISITGLRCTLLGGNGSAPAQEHTQGNTQCFLRIPREKGGGTREMLCILDVVPLANLWQSRWGRFLTLSFPCSECLFTH